MFIAKPFSLSSQEEINIIDPNNIGVILYSDENYQGDEKRLVKFDTRYNSDFVVKSIKVLGNYKLHSSRQVIISSDTKKITLSDEFFWIEESNSFHVAIAYSDTNFKGQATYLKVFQVYNSDSIKSLKMAGLHVASLLNKEGEMWYTCKSISNITEPSLTIQIKPGKCK